MLARKYSPVFALNCDIAQVAAVAARPAAMHPRALHQRDRRLRVEFVDRVKSAVGAAQILGVKPAAHHQHRAAARSSCAAKVARLPVGVVGVVLAWSLKSQLEPFR
jgi:hypothetical protein